eukprot:Anaeramoba_flamelloidesa86421_82.p1 GENE.a86421_82~~a86421_82.p1  ORF type:complete len:167 (+),score=40.96 a86421_82:124-624(+)
MENIMPNLLSGKDRGVCENISVGEDTINKKRAIALLSIDNGNTQIKAAEDSGLSVGQVRYFLSKYRTLGISCFPSELMETKKEEIEQIEETQAKEIQIEVPIETIEKKEEEKVVKKKSTKKKEKKKEEKKPKKKVFKKKDKTKKDKKESSTKKKPKKKKSKNKEKK